MNTGWLLGGIASLLYAALVGFFGGVKKSPTFLKLVKMKINKNMSDEKAITVSIIVATIVGAFSVFCFIFGAIKGA